MKNSRAIWLLLLANSISGVAQGISALAIPWYFTGMLHSESLFGSVYFVITAISLVWGVYAGTLVDRYDRKNVFLAINITAVIILSAVTFLGYRDGSLPWILVALVFAVSIFINNIHYPNLYAFVHEITPKHDYARVTSMLEIQGQVTFTLSGGLAALLLKGIDDHINFFGTQITTPFAFRAWQIHEIFAVNALAYVLAFVIIYSIKSLPVIEKKIDTGNLSERIKTGFTFLRKHPLLFNFGNASLFVFDTIIVCVTFVLPVYVDKFLNRSGDVYALADMTFSMGALLAGIITTRVFGDKQAVRGIIILMFLAGAMYAVLIFNKILFVFFAVQFVIGLCNAAIRIQRVTYLFHHIPNHVIGRTNSVFFLINVFFRLCLIGLFTLPFFHQQTQIVYAMVVFAIICAIGVIILGANYKRLIHEPVTQ